MKYCCPGFEYAVNNADERTVSISVQETHDEPIIFIAAKAVADADMPKLARQGEILRKAGSQDYFSMTLVAYSPIKYCPWCGTSLHRFYRKSWRELPKVEGP